MELLQSERFAWLTVSVVLSLGSVIHHFGARGDDSSSKVPNARFQADRKLLVDKGEMAWTGLWSYVKL